MTRKRFLPGVLFAALLSFIAVFAGSDLAHAGTFDPTLGVEVADTTPETPSDILVDFGLPTESVQFAGVIQFIPQDWGIVRGDSIPIGTDVGFLDSEATLGLVNASCQQVLPVHFDFKNSSIDITDTVSFLDDDENGTADFAEDKDENGDYDSVDKYPSFLNSLFDGKKPIRRSSGVTLVAAIPVLLQFLIFPPGTLINENIPNDESLGFPSVTVLQNIGDPDAYPSPGAITDFCAPLVTNNVSLGQTEDGRLLFVNPLNGKYTFNTIAVGQRDADDDGFENSLDTCALVANEGSPKVPGIGDLDSDGLDAVCDPDDDPDTGTNSDEDADGYLNRQDNCPLTPNGEPFDEANPGEDETNQADEDIDQIGDVCDPEPAVENGDLHTIDPILSVEVVIGDGTGEGGPPSEQACPDCFRGVVVDDGGGSSGVLIGVIVAVIAAIVIIGGGAALMMRRRRAV